MQISSGSEWLPIQGILHHLAQVQGDLVEARKASPTPPVPRASMLTDFHTRRSVLWIHSISAQVPLERPTPSETKNKLRIQCSSENTCL